MVSNENMLMIPTATPDYNHPAFTLDTSFIHEEQPKNLLNEDDTSQATQVTNNNNTTDQFQTTLNDERPNEPFGDCPDIKDPKHDRWYLQNVNGISTNYDWMAWKMILAELHKLQVDGFSITEPNLNWTPENTHRAQTLGRNWFKAFRLNTVSSNDPTTRKYYQPGGICTGIANSMAGRTTKQGSDPSGLGRWTYSRMEGKMNHDTEPPTPTRVYFVTSYCVSQSDSSNPGTETVFMQQKRLLTLQGIANPKPRQQWTEDITKQLKTWINERAKVILCMDANADLDDAHIQKLLRDTGMVDLVAHHLGSDLPETYVNGKKRVDHYFGTPDVAPAVKRVAILAYNEGIVADHRGIIIDFDRNSLYGQTHELEERQQRLLTTHNKRGAQTYREAASQAIREHNIIERIKDIETRANIEFTDEVIAELEQLDTDFHHILLSAETKIEKHTHLPWSPILHKAFKVWQYWKIKLSFVKTKRQSGRRVTIFMFELAENVDITQGDDTRSTTAQLRMAQKALRIARQQSRRHRDDHLERIVIDHELEDKPEKAKIAKRIQRAEAQTKMYRIFRKYLKPQATALTHVEIPENPLDDPKTATKWKKVFGKDALEKILHERNQQHFAQAATDKTPFTQDPLYSLLKFTTDTEFSEQFRKGEVDLTTLDLDDDVLALLEELLPNETDPPKISEEMTVQEVMSGFKKWNEQTTTGGRHLGHYKSWIMKRGEDEPSLTDETFFTLLITIYQICLKNRYPLKRWKTCLNLFIPKDPGSCKLHRLRVIHIVDTCLNFLRRFFIARRLLRHVEDHHALASEQWGGRPGRTAIDLVMSKEIMLTTLHLMRHNGGITDVDATACYDRIAPSPMFLSYSKSGATNNIVFFLAYALIQLTYFIVTAFGTSTLYNQHSDDSQFLGPGQGATDAPFAWGVVSTMLIRAYNKRAHGGTLADPTGEITWKRAIDMFVDDAYLFHILQMLMGARRLMQNISHDIALWAKLLWASGGAINFQKSFYSILIWKFTPDGHAYLLKNTELPSNTVQVPNPGDETKHRTIKRVCVSEASKTLGVMKAADLTQTAEYKNLRKKTYTFTKALAACPMSHYHAWLGYMTVYVPGVTYSFPTTSLTEKQCIALQTIFKATLLQKMGLPPTLPLEIVYGDKYFGGIGLLILFAEQGMQQTLLLMRHVRANTTLGQQIIIALRYYQLHAGIADSVLENTQPLPYMRFPWIDSLRQYLYQISGTIKLTEPWLQTKQRKGDSFIMEEMLQSKRFTDSELSMIYNCRLYLQVSRVSDITTTDGNRIATKMLAGDREDNADLRTQEYTWPRQERPQERAWKTWRTAITTVISTTAGKLHKPLGEWHHNHEASWNYLASNSTRKLYHRTQQGWRCHSMTRNGRIKKYETEHRNIKHPPQDAYPMTPIRAHNTIMCPNSESSKQTVPRIVIPEVTNLREYLDTQTEPWERPLLKNAKEITCHRFELKDHLHMGTPILFVSDGGLTDGLGTFGWVIATDTGTLCEGLGLSAGNQHLNESLRSESTGFLAQLRYLLHYVRYYKVSPEKSNKVHYCDNQGVISRGPDTYRTAPPNPHDFLKADYDVQMQIMQTIRLLDIEIPSIHVKGHQDDNKSPIENLSYESQLNIKADALATKAWEQNKCGHPFIHYPDSKCSLIIDKAAVTRAFRPTMRKAYSSQEIRQYLTTKYEWRQDTCTTIDWYSHGSAIEALPPNQQRFVQRFIIDWLPVNNRLQERDRAPCNKCTRCNKEIETETHFLQCTANTNTRAQLVKQLRTTFNKHKVDPQLRKLIYQGIQLAMDPQSTKGTTMDNVPEEYDPLIQEQGNLGWTQLWYGRFAIEWDRYQRRYLKLVYPTEKEPSGEPKWLRAVILTIWQHAYVRWIERTNHQYGTNQTSNFRHDQLLQQIEALYAHQPNILVQDQYMFTTTIEDWKDTTTHQREDWLNKYRPVIKKCITMAKRQLEKNASDMRGYFPTTAKLPILPSTKRRTRSPTSTKRTKQLDLNNNPVSNPRKTQKQKTNKKQKSKKKTTTPHDNNADITSAVTSPITPPRNDQDIRKLFPPRDKRDNHRKAHAPRQNITQRSKQP
jgi:hypothetical protein